MAATASQRLRRVITPVFMGQSNSVTVLCWADAVAQRGYRAAVASGSGGRDTVGERAPTVKPRWSVAAERQSEVGEVVVRDPLQAQRDTPGQLVAA